MLKITQEPTMILKNDNSIQNILDSFKTDLKENNFEEEDIKELVNAYSKNPTDNYIVSSNTICQTFGRQGDILFWAEGSEMYNSEINNVSGLHPTNSLILQDGESLTGDHRLIILDGSNYSLLEGYLRPSFLKSTEYRIQSFRCFVLTIDKPFLVYHSEHGNMAYPKGTYMICSQIDPYTLSNMED